MRAGSARARTPGDRANARACGAPSARSSPAGNRRRRPAAASDRVLRVFVRPRDTSRTTRRGCAAAIAGAPEAWSRWPWVTRTPRRARALRSERRRERREMPRMADAGVDQQRRSACDPATGTCCCPRRSSDPGCARRGDQVITVRATSKNYSEAPSVDDASCCRYWPRKSSASAAQSATRAHGGAPVLAARLRVFGLARTRRRRSGGRRLRTRRCDSDRSCTTRARRCDRVRPRSGANVSAARRVGHDLAGVPADEHPFAGLALELDDVQHVLVGRAAASTM